MAANGGCMPSTCRRGGGLVNRLTGERSAERRRIRELEAELQRKDKALAETAALLVLRKKAQAIWGEAAVE